MENNHIFAKYLSYQQFINSVPLGAQNEIRKHL